MKRSFKSYYYWILALFLLIAIGVSFQSFYLPYKGVDHNDILYSQYNNYVIYKYSYIHLVENVNMYIEIEEEYYDLFKYTPTFALFMGLFAFLPDIVGLILWNMLNAIVLISAIRYIPFNEKKKNLLMLAYIGLELITNLQSSQSNALMAGLIIWGFNSIEKKQIIRATLFVALSVYVKLFGLIAFAFFIFYPNRIKSALYSIGWMLVLFLLPLTAIRFPELLEQYANYIHMLQNDHSSSIGLSIMGWLETWFGIAEVKLPVLILGVLLLLAPLLRFKYYNNLNFRLFYLANLLIWMVIFNHKAESPTFIIAISGVAIWYFSQAKTKLNLTLLLLALIFTSLSPTDLFPRSIREEWITPYVLKAVPCIFIWFKLSFDLLVKKEFSFSNKAL